MKKKLFLCFRPIAVKIETESVGPDSFDDHISSAPTTPAKSRSPKTCFLKKSPVSAVKRSRFSDKEIPEKKRGRSKSFSGFALFEISLKKKAGDKKASVKIVEDSRISDSTKRDALFSDAAPKSSPPTLSSSSTNSLPTPKTPSEENKDFPTEPSTPVIQKKHIIHQGRRKSETKVINGLRNSYEGMLLILINLVITVFYGRLCAVLFSCLFLYSIYRLRNSKRLVEPAEKAAAAAETVERDYRKRVIMEGLLQRNNHHHHQRRGH
ncbi:hypothetical protein RHGRI_017824 [Rhododendron griersonianum]|uniref:Uncharacterized protein n=1 Tax=Rhododendron griersonianum TaxID=479676 RepID=A0AAV6JZ78_9ERIC|nr:hypothetical protein RHGRI_017824 [Rhododendron griersonianum]